MPAIKGTFTREERRQTNGPSVKTDGFEIALEYRWEKMRAYFNYTYNLSIYENGEKIPEIGNNVVNAGMLYAFTKRIKLDVRGHYLGRRKNVKMITATGSDYIDNAVILNATFSLLNVKGFDFQIICKNLLDTEYYHPSNNPPERYRQPQRTFLIKAGYNF